MRGRTRAPVFHGPSIFAVRFAFPARRYVVMAVQLKPLDQQVIVITGASSGIGLCTALLAAERGARLVLAARSGGNCRP